MNTLSDTQALRDLAESRRAAVKARKQRVLDLHKQRLPLTVISRRLGVAHDWAKRVLLAAGVRPWKPCEVDTEGIGA